MSVIWSLTAGQVIQRAYLMIGSLSPPWTPSDFQTAQGMTVLNGLLKGMETAGINVFRQTQISLTIPAMTPSILIDPYVMGIEDARWVVTPAPNLYERLLGYFSYEDYQTLPNKLSPASSPSVYAFNRQVNTSSIYIWPVVSVSGTINATVGRSANDVLLTTDPIDLPQEWILGLTYLLADALMDDQGVAAFDPQTAQRISGHAQYWKQKLEDWDRPTSIFIRPWGKAGRGRMWR